MRSSDYTQQNLVKEYNNKWKDSGQLMFIRNTVALPKKKGYGSSNRQPFFSFFIKKKDGSIDNYLNIMELK